MKKPLSVDKGLGFKRWGQDQSAYWPAASMAALSLTI